MSAMMSRAAGCHYPAGPYFHLPDATEGDLSMMNPDTAIQPLWPAHRL